MNTAQHNFLPSLPELRGNLVGAGSVTGHYGDPHEVTGMIEIDILDSFVHEIDGPGLRCISSDDRQT